MAHMRKLFLFLFLLAFVRETAGQELGGKGPDGFRWRLIGRAFFDGGVFLKDTARENSFQINDLRVGTIIHFLDAWEAKIELGYGDSKISLKDVYLNYEYKNSSFRLGYHFEPFGNARVGTSNYRFITNAVSDKALGNSRKLGFSYSYNHKWFNFIGGVFSDGDIQKSKPVNQGYSLAAKVVGRPLMEDKKLIHIGVAPRFNSSHKEVSFSARAPTDLLAKADNTFLDAHISQVINQWKLDLETILLYNKWYFQGQYFLASLNRFAAENYKAKGGYAQCGYMVLGAKHNYNAKTGMIVNPAPRSLEILLRYDNMNLNDAGIRGGRLSDISVGVNYFINKYVAAKVNYTRMMIGHSSPQGKDDFDLLQGRVQISF